MTFDLSPARIRISIRALQPLVLACARGTRVRATAGVVWVTVDHDTRDWVLEPGDEMVVESNDRVLMTALGRDETTIDLCASRPRLAAGLVARIAARLGAAIARLGARRPAAGPAPA